MPSFGKYSLWFMYTRFRHWGEKKKDWWGQSKKREKCHIQTATLGFGGELQPVDTELWREIGLSVITFNLSWRCGAPRRGCGDVPSDNKGPTSATDVQLEEFCHRMFQSTQTQLDDLWTQAQHPHPPLWQWRTAAGAGSALCCSVKGQRPQNPVCLKGLQQEVCLPCLSPTLSSA